MKKQKNNFPSFSIKDLINQYTSPLTLKILYCEVEKENESIEFLQRKKHSELEIASKMISDSKDLQKFKRKIKKYERAGANISRYEKILEDYSDK